jgi:hypothetical protein
MPAEQGQFVPLENKNIQEQRRRPTDGCRAPGQASGREPWDALGNTSSPAPVGLWTQGLPQGAIPASIGAVLSKIDERFARSTAQPTTADLWRYERNASVMPRTGIIDRTILENGQQLLGGSVSEFLVHPVKTVNEFGDVNNNVADQRSMVMRQTQFLGKPLFTAVDMIVSLIQQGFSELTLVGDSVTRMIFEATIQVMKDEDCKDIFSGWVVRSEDGQTYQINLDEDTTFVVRYIALSTLRIRGYQEPENEGEWWWLDDLVREFQQIDRAVVVVSTGLHYTVREVSGDAAGEEYATHVAALMAAMVALSTPTRKFIWQAPSTQHFLGAGGEYWAPSACEAVPAMPWLAGRPNCSSVSKLCKQGADCNLKPEQQHHWRIAVHWHVVHRDRG